MREFDISPLKTKMKNAKLFYLIAHYSLNTKNVHQILTIIRPRLGQNRSLSVLFKRNKTFCCVKYLTFSSISYNANKSFLEGIDLDYLHMPAH
jgi:hypothetical protein